MLAGSVLEGVQEMELAEGVPCSRLEGGAQGGREFLEGRKDSFNGLIMVSITVTSTGRRIKSVLHMVNISMSQKKCTKTNYFSSK